MNAFRSRGSEAARRGDLLPPQPLGKAEKSPVRLRSADIVDVEFETLAGDGRRGGYRVYNDNLKGRAPVRAAGSPITIGTSGGRTSSMRIFSRVERVLQRVSLTIFASVVAGLCLCVFALIFASNSNAPPAPVAEALVLDHVTTALSDANGMKMISVFGAVENRVTAARTVPPILVNIIDNGRKTATVTLPAEDTALAGGESRPFTVRLPHAGGKLPEVKLSFAETGAPLR